jgi:hypothetical protein
MVICAPRRAAQAPDRNVTHTISSSANSVTTAMSRPKTCSTTLANTSAIITAPMATTVQSTTAPNAASTSGADGATGRTGLRVEDDAARPGTSGPGSAVALLLVLTFPPVSPQCRRLLPFGWRAAPGRCRRGTSREPSFSPRTCHGPVATSAPIWPEWPCARFRHRRGSRRRPHRTSPSPSHTPASPIHGTGRAPAARSSPPWRSFLRAAAHRWT